MGSAIVGFISVGLMIVFAAWLVNIYQRNVAFDAEMAEMDEETTKELAAIDARELRECRTNSVYLEMYQEDCALQEEKARGS